MSLGLGVSHGMKKAGRHCEAAGKAAAAVKKGVAATVRGLFRRKT